MFKTAFFMTVIVLAVMLPARVFAEPNMHLGQWQITSTIEMPGMAYKMPATTHTQCIGSADSVPRDLQGNDKCEMIETAVAGDTVTWQVKCESEGGTMTSQGRIVYAGESFEGTIVTNSSQMPDSMTQKMTGKRIGDCK